MAFRPSSAAFLVVAFGVTIAFAAVEAAKTRSDLPILVNGDDSIGTRAGDYNCDCYWVGTSYYCHKCNDLGTGAIVGISLFAAGLAVFGLVMVCYCGGWCCFKGRGYQNRRRAGQVHTVMTVPAGQPAPAGYYYGQPGVSIVNQYPYPTQHQYQAPPAGGAGFVQPQPVVYYNNGVQVS